jgi:hypothetical protein
MATFDSSNLSLSGFLSDLTQEKNVLKTSIFYSGRTSYYVSDINSFWNVRSISYSMKKVAGSVTTDLGAPFKKDSTLSYDDNYYTSFSGTIASSDKFFAVGTCYLKLILTSPQWTVSSFETSSIFSTTEDGLSGSTPTISNISLFPTGGSVSWTYDSKFTVPVSCSVFFTEENTSISSSATTLGTTTGVSFRPVPSTSYSVQINAFNLGGNPKVVTGKELFQAAPSSFTFISVTNFMSNSAVVTYNGGGGGNEFVDIFYGLSSRSITTKLLTVNNLTSPASITSISMFPGCAYIASLTSSNTFGMIKSSSNIFYTSVNKPEGVFLKHRFQSYSVNANVFWSPVGGSDVSYDVHVLKSNLGGNDLTLQSEQVAVYRNATSGLAVGSLTINDTYYAAYVVAKNARGEIYSDLSPSVYRNNYGTNINSFGFGFTFSNGWFNVNYNRGGVDQGIFLNSISVDVFSSPNGLTSNMAYLTTTKFNPEPNSIQGTVSYNFEFPLQRGLFYAARLSTLDPYQTNRLTTMSSFIRRNAETITNQPAILSLNPTNMVIDFVPTPQLSTYVFAVREMNTTLTNSAIKSTFSTFTSLPTSPLTLSLPASATSGKFYSVVLASSEDFSRIQSGYQSRQY